MVSSSSPSAGSANGAFDAVVNSGAEAVLAMSGGGRWSHAVKVKFRQMALANVTNQRGSRIDIGTLRRSQDRRDFFLTSRRAAQPPCEPRSVK